MMRFALTAAAAIALLAACGPQQPAASTESAPEPAPAVEEAAVPPGTAVSGWAGQWNGPEGTYLKIEPAAGDASKVTLTIANLDGPKTFPGVVKGDTIEFIRDGVTETIKAGDGAATGMKWLAEKKDCLLTKSGEGWCRD